MAIGKIKTKDLAEDQSQVDAQNKTQKPNKFARIGGLQDKKIRTHADIQIIEKIEEEGSLEFIDLNSITELFVENKEMHNRTTFSQESIEKLAKDITLNKGKGVLKTGLLHPIIVRRGKGGKYERITGFRRQLACMLNNETKIPALVIEADDATARAIRHSENAQRERLNDYDELISILEDLSYTSSLSFEQIVAFIKKSKYHFDKSKTNFSFNDQELEILEITIQRLELISSYKIAGLEKRLKILDMDELILDEMKLNNISFSNALEINKLQKKEDIVFFLEFNKKNQPTVEELKLAIVSSTQREKISKKNPLSELKQTFGTIKVTRYNKLTSSQKEKINSLSEEIAEKLKEIDKISSLPQ